jgi:hypothetical protein
MGKEIPAVAMEQAKIDARIVDLIARLAIADLEIDHVMGRAIDELMPVGTAGGKARRHARGQALGAGIGHELDLAFENIDELVLGAVPVTLCRGDAWRRRTRLTPK